MVIADNYSTLSCHVVASTSTACRGQLVRVLSLGDAVAVVPCCGRLLRLETVWSRAPSFVFASPPVAGALGNRVRRTCHQRAFAGSAKQGNTGEFTRVAQRGVCCSHLSLELRRIIVQCVCGHRVHDVVNSRLQEYQLQTHNCSELQCPPRPQASHAYLQTQKHRVDTQHRPPVVPKNRHHDFARGHVHIRMPHATATAEQLAKSPRSEEPTAFGLTVSDMSRWALE